MKIGDLAKKTGLSADAIRFYEKSGLIHGAPRAENGYREFSPELVDVLTFISHCRSLDIPLLEIKKLLVVRSGASKSCKDANLVVDTQLKNLRERIRELKNLEQQLAKLRSICNEEIDPKHCKIIQSLQGRGDNESGNIKGLSR